MFVQTNSVRAVKEYIKNRLMEHFSESEIRSIVTAKFGFDEPVAHEYTQCLAADTDDALYQNEIVKGRAALVKAPFVPTTLSEIPPLNVTEWRPYAGVHAADAVRFVRVP